MFQRVMFQLDLDQRCIETWEWNIWSDIP